MRSDAEPLSAGPDEDRIELWRMHAAADLSVSQQVFQEQYGLSTEFPLFFGLLASSIALVAGYTTAGVLVLTATEIAERSALVRPAPVFDCR